MRKSIFSSLLRKPLAILLKLISQLFKVIKSILGEISSFFWRAISWAMKLLNRFVSWHKLPWWAGVLNLLVFRDDLRKHNLHDTSDLRKYDLPDTDPETRPTPEIRWDPSFSYSRSPDGTFNDLEDPKMGAAKTRLGRNFPFDKIRVEDEKTLLKPSPREVSLKLMTRQGFRPAKTLNLLAAAWIQFQVHDWFSHRTNDKDDHLRIKLKPGDPWPDDDGEMKIERTERDSSRDQHASPDRPTFLNTETHWWDASQLYGSSLDRQLKLRSRSGGKLEVQQVSVSHGTLEDRLPVENTGDIERIDLTGFNNNYWVGLSLLHTLFALEHNAICDRLQAEYPAWDDDRLFATARLINSALIAKIHTVEWTPAILGHPALEVAMYANWWGIVTEKITKNIGRISDREAISGIPGSTKNHHTAPYYLTEEFVSVYRMHPLIPDDFRIYSLRNEQLVKEATLREVEGARTRGFVESYRMEDLLYSFGLAHPGAITLHNFPRSLQNFERADGVRLDLAAVDVMRDRERGVPRYNEFRRLLRLPPARSFEELTGNRYWADELKKVYDGNIDKVDLMVGLYAEPLPEGFGFSDTAFRIFILMASRRLKSDRFFTTDYRPEVYTQVGLDWINENGMKSVLQRHFPALTPAFQNVPNPFAPWKRVRGSPSRPPNVANPEPQTRLTGFARLRWRITKWFWDLVARLKFRFNKPLEIHPPEGGVDKIDTRPLAKRFPSIPINNIPVARRVPKDERDWKKEVFYAFQVGMYKICSPMQDGLPEIDPDPEKALNEAYTVRHRKYFQPPVLPEEYEGDGNPDLGSLAVAGPYASYLKKDGEGTFKWDVWDLCQYEHHEGLYKLGVRVWFRKKPPCPALEAYRIECEDGRVGTVQLGDSNWSLATKIALCTVSTHVSLVRHFNWVHLASGAPLALATRNCLPRDHKVCRLLWPHIYGTQQSNKVVTKGQMVKRGDFATIFSFTHKGMCDLFRDTYSQFTLSVIDPEQDAEERGIKNQGFTIPTQENLEELFNVMHRHAENYLHLYYNSDPALQQDGAVSKWLATLDSSIPNGIAFVRANDITVKNVARLIGSFIYLVTVQHDRLGTAMWNYQLWVHKQPVRVYVDGRREPLDVYQRLVNANYNLNVRRKQLLDDFSDMALSPEGDLEFHRFREELEALQRRMETEPWAPWRIYPNMLEVNINA